MRSPDTYIEDMEAAGQTQIVNSDVLPVKILHCKKEDFIQLGFIFDKPDPDDLIFCKATLPAGWSREGSDHAMWSYIIDEKGRKRVSVFYKAAFYDRHSHMSLNRRYGTRHDDAGIAVIDCDKEIHFIQGGSYEDAEAYLNAHYPEWRNYMAYWDD